jgi:molybdopterin synthase catalytic subunit
VGVRIQREPIVEEELLSRLRDPAHGARVLFLGVVRNHHAGRAVAWIDYHAYEAMAGLELLRIEAELQERHPGIELGIVHRIGRVEVGEASLAVAASAAHRPEALAAVARAVDEIKRRVPIWKKEHGPDGSFWVEGQRPEALPPIVEGRP